MPANAVALLVLSTDSAEAAEAPDLVKKALQ
jgi:hypothetical protein